jgi:hypothetical protein
MMTEAEAAELEARWEQPLSLEAPEGDDDAATLDGIYPLPGMSVEELIRRRATLTA